MINFNKQCVYVINKQPVWLDCLGDSELSKLNLESAYACMYADDVTVITIVSGGSDSCVRILMFKDASDYSSTLDCIKSNCHNVRFSRQNSKLIDYSRQISSKLRSGIEIAIVDAQCDDNVIECPCCGVKNEWNPAMPFCLECGETLTKN